MLVARAGVRREAVAWDDDGSLWWSEARPDAGGAEVVVRRAPDRTVADASPPGVSARTRAHEYGGGAWLPVDGRLVLADGESQRLLLVDGTEVRPLTPEPAQPQGERYADLVASPDRREVWCVREAVGPAGVQRALVAVALDGSGVRVLGTDRHLLSTPRPSPDGRRLAWLTWEHPRMPWDGTELRVAEVRGDGTLGPARTGPGSSTPAGTRSPPAHRAASRSPTARAPAR